MLITGLVIGALLFAGRAAIYFILFPPGLRAWLEQSTKRMMILELTNILTIKVGGAITGIFAGATVAILGILLSIILVQLRTWKRPTFKTSKAW